MLTNNGSGNLRHPATRELAEASVVYYNWQYLIAKIQRSGETTKKKEEKMA